MGRYRKIDTRIWVDDGFRKLSGFEPSAKALWLWLLTTPRSSNFSAAVPAGIASIADDLRWSTNAADKALVEIETSGMVRTDREARLIYLINWLHYNQPESPNVVAGWVTSIGTLPECELRRVIIKDVLDAVNAIGPGFSSAFTRTSEKVFGAGWVDTVWPDVVEKEQKEQPLEQSQLQIEGEVPDQKQRECDVIGDVYNHYKKYHQRSAPTIVSTSREYRLIRDRIREGFSVDDLKLAIDGNHISEFHCGKNEDKKQYHGIDLIFRDSAHVTRFIEEMSRPHDFLTDGGAQ